MVRTYRVPHCNSGNDLKNDRIPLFRAPADTNRLAAWNLAVPQWQRNLRTCGYICAKHFKPSDISAPYYSEFKGHALLHKNKKPRLARYAIPIIFSGDSPQVVTKRKRLKKVDHSNQTCALETQGIASIQQDVAMRVPGPSHTTSSNSGDSVYSTN